MPIRWVTLLAILVALSGWASQSLAQPAHLPDELLVAPKGGITLAEAQEVYRRHGAALLEVLPGINVHRIQVAPQALEAVEQALRQDPKVEWVTRNGIPTLHMVPDEALYPTEGNIPKISPPSAWDLSQGSPVQDPLLPTSEYQSRLAALLRDVLPVAPPTPSPSFASGSNVKERVKPQPTPAPVPPPSGVVTPTPAPASSSALEPRPLGSIRVGEWYEIPNSRLDAVLPAPIPEGGWTGPSAIMSAWNSAALDTKRRQLLVHGGGHADYPGNEVYRFSLDTLAWQLLVPPSYAYPIIDKHMNVDAYPDGTPAAVHTYGGFLYAPNIDRVVRIGGSLWSEGGGTSATWWLDLDAKTWAQKANIPSQRFLGETATYDPVTGLVWHRAYNKIQTYDPRTDQWVDDVSTSDAGLNDGFNAVIDPKRRLLLLIGAGYFLVYHLDALQPLNAETWVTTGANQIVNAYAPGLVYDPVLDRIVAWNGGAAVYVLNLDTKVWTTVVGTGVVPPPAQPAGTWGRFAYSPADNVYLAVNAIDQNVFALRLSGIASPAVALPPSSLTLPPPSDPPSSASISPGDSKAGSIASDSGSSNQVIVLTAPPPPSTLPQPPASGFDIPVRTWVPYPLPDLGKGPFPALGGKHARLLFDSLRQRMVLTGGDWMTAANPDDQNGQNETWSIDLANIPAGWTQEYPYCGPAGDVQPARPDEVTWVYDSVRDRYWIIPGFFFGVPVFNAACGTTGSTPLHRMLAFNAATRKWRDAQTAPYSIPWPPPEGVPGDSNAKHGVYDPVTDAIYRFYWGTWGSQVQIIHLATATWETILVGQTPPNEVLRETHLEMEYEALDVAGRWLYSLDPFLKKLFRYNIDTKEAQFASDLPASYAIGPSDTPQGRSMMVFDPANRVLLIPNTQNLGGEILRLFIYHVDTQTWETEEIPNLGIVSGYAVMGNVLGFDEANNTMLLIGGHGQDPPEPSVLDPSRQTQNPKVFWLYRYGNGSVHRQE